MGNEKQKSGFNFISGIAVTIVGLLITPMGISGLLHTSFDAAGWILLIFTLSGFLLLASGITMLIQSRSQNKSSGKLLNTIVEAQKNNLILSEIEFQPVRAHWLIDKPTWNNFKQNETKYRLHDNIYFFIAFAVAGAVLITINKGAVIGRAFIVSVIIGIIIVVIRRAIAMAKLKSKTKYQELYLTDYFIVLNGEKYLLFGDGVYTSSVRLFDNTSPIILEFKIHWKTRNGVTFDELRLPVPPAEITKATNFCSNFISKHALHEK